MTRPLAIVYLWQPMGHRIHTEADLAAAVSALLAADPRWQKALALGGHPPLRRRPDGFAGLAATVVGQQLSIASAAAILRRLTAAFDPLDHAGILRARPTRLARIGLSAAKIRTLKAIARAVQDGALDLPALAEMPVEGAHAALTAIHGIGPWTADSYLLFCLGHADAWPAGDLALQEALRMLLSLEARPTTQEMAMLAEGWRPYRGAAAWILWNYYKHAKLRDRAAVPRVRRSQVAPKPVQRSPMGLRASGGRYGG